MRNIVQQGDIIPLTASRAVTSGQGVDNFTNKKPPLRTTATGAGSAIYNVLGRRFLAGFRARF